MHTITFYFKTHDELQALYANPAYTIKHIVPISNQAIMVTAAPVADLRTPNLNAQAIVNAYVTSLGS